MHFQLKLTDGSKVDLSFSMYFLNCACKITGFGISDIFKHLIGDVVDLDKEIIRGGILDDLEVRAAVVAAGMEAAGFESGNHERKTLIDGWQVLNQVENSLKSPVWAEMFVELCKSLIAENLPKEPGTKKKEEVKKLPGRTSKIPALAK